MYTAIMTNVQNIIIYVKNCLINRSSSPLWRRGVYVHLHMHSIWLVLGVGGGVVGKQI